MHVISYCDCYKLFIISLTDYGDVYSKQLLSDKFASA